MSTYARTSKRFRFLSGLLCGFTMVACAPRMSVVNPTVPASPRFARPVSQTFSALRQPATGRAKPRQGLRLAPQPTAPAEVHPGWLLYINPEQDFKPGDLITGRGQRGEDFIRTVKRSYAQGQGRVVVETNPVDLNSAFEDLDVQAPNKNGGRGPGEPRTLTLKEYEIEITPYFSLITSLEMTPDFSKTRLKMQGDKIWIHFHPRVELSYAIRPNFHLSLDDPLAKIPGVSEPVPLKNHTFKGMLGFIPVSYELNLGAQLKSEAQGNGGFAFSTSAEGELNRGVDMELGLRQRPVIKSSGTLSFKPKFNKPRLDFEGEVSMRLYVPTVEMRLSIAGAGGPFIKIAPYLESRLSQVVELTGPRREARTDIDVHLAAEVAGGLSPNQLFGKDMMPAFEKKLWEKELRKVYEEHQTRPIS